MRSLTPPAALYVMRLMRFPLALTARIAGYIIGKKARGVKKFATVLQLEPLHTCNLTCTGCGRIREYSTSMKDGNWGSFSFSFSETKHHNVSGTFFSIRDKSMR